MQMGSMMPEQPRTEGYDMPHVRNGSYRGAATVVPPIQFNITGGKVFGAILIAIGVLLNGQWLILPAKDSDLKNVQRELGGLRDDVQTMTLDIRGIRADNTQLRVELVRLGSTLEVAPLAPAPVAVAPHRRIRIKPRVAAETVK